MNKMSILIAALALFLFSCSKETITGSGSVSTKTLIVPAFTSVETHYDIDANISYGSNQELLVTGYDNLLNILDFRVENGVLKLKFNTQYNYIRKSNVSVSIKIPAVRSFAIHGSGDIRINNFPNIDTLKARIHGSGDINVINSAGNFALLDVYGSGDISAQSLVAKKAEVNIHGSGDTRISVAEKLTARIFGSGDVLYWGNPLLETERNGSGRVVKQ